jgi:signal transduction histidine kinase
MKSRLPFWSALLAALFILQGMWWSLLLWRNSDTEREIELRLLQERLKRAEVQLEYRMEGAPSSSADDIRREAWGAMQPQFSGIVLVPPGGLQISSKAIDELNDAQTGQQTMVIGEASAFLIVVVLGLGLLVRTYRREAFLSLQQSNFLHAVTHEFRSPLQSLQLTLETLIRRPNPQRAKRYADDMLEDIARLDSLVDNVLAVGRLEAEPFRTQTQIVEMPPAIEAVIQRFKLAHPTLADRIQFDLDPSLLAEADPTTLEPVVRNLLENALKYGDNKPVSLRLDQDSGYVRLTVRDSGRGLKADELPHLFNRFWRAGDERVRTAPGTGLGLFLTRELLKAQGATITAQSDGPGKGASFRVMWPMASG